MIGYVPVEEVRNTALGLLFCVLGIAIITFHMIFKYGQLRNFITENKLQKKFQEYRNDNKGL